MFDEMTDEHDVTIGQNLFCQGVAQYADDPVFADVGLPSYIASGVPQGRQVVSIINQ